MTIFQDARRRVTATLPSLPEVQAYEKARKSYEALVDERHRVGASLDSLMSVERPAALRQDQEALAQAIRRGKAEPELDEATAAVDAQIAAARRRFDALEVAVATAEEEFVSLHERHGAAWLAESRKAEETERERYAQAVEALIEARDRLSARAAITRFLAEFPTARYRPQPLRFAGTIRGVDGELLFWQSIANALRLDAERPAPQRQPATGLPSISSILVGDADHPRRLGPVRPTAPQAAA